MKALYKLIVPFALMLLVIACNSDGCDYDVHIGVLTKVVEITPDPEAEGLLKVKLEFEKTALYGTDQYLEELRNTPIDSAFLKRNGIYIGQKFFTTVSLPKPKNCKSLLVSFDYRFKDAPTP